MFLPNSNSFLLVRSKISKPVIQSGIFGVHPIRSRLAEVSLETRAFGASETSNGIQESVLTPDASVGTSGPPPPSSDSGGKIFLSNSYSFLLVRPVISRKMFLPNSHSFLFVRSVISKPVIQSDIEESVLISESGHSPSSSDSGKSTIVNKDKRTFLKAAGIASASLAGSLLLPKKAEALIMGSSPTTGVVGVKNSSNVRINPATEETLDEVLKTQDLDFDGSGYLNVNVQTTAASSSSSFSDVDNNSLRGLVDAARHVQVDVLSSTLPTAASTENTLTAINFGGKKLILRLVTVGSIDYVGEAEIGTAADVNAWRIKRIHNNFDGNSNISITWAGGVATFSKYWDNGVDSYATYTYS